MTTYTSKDLLSFAYKDGLIQDDEMEAEYVLIDVSRQQVFIAGQSYATRSNCGYCAAVAVVNGQLIGEMTIYEPYNDRPPELVEFLHGTSALDLI